MIPDPNDPISFLTNVVESEYKRQVARTRAAAAPRKRMKAPSIKTIERWDWERGGCKATDGCWVEPDGTCEHGCPSWQIELGLI